MVEALVTLARAGATVDNMTEAARRLSVEGASGKLAAGRGISMTNDKLAAADLAIRMELLRHNLDPEEVMGLVAHLAGRLAAAAEVDYPIGEGLDWHNSGLTNYQLGYEQQQLAQNNTSSTTAH
jgi:hypothetical protein